MIPRITRLTELLHIFKVKEMVLDTIVQKDNYLITTVSNVRHYSPGG